MAQQSAVKRAVTVPKRAPEEVPAPSKKAARVFDYAKFRQSIRDDKDFAIFLAGYPNKTGILAYVYRLKPVIDNALAGISESSIYKTSAVAEMNQEFIASKFGRGRYMLRLTDANRPKGETDVAKTWFQVDDPELTPIYDPRTLKLSDPENQDEVSRLFQAGVLIRDGATGAPRLRNQHDEPGPAAAAAAGNGQVNSDIFSRDVLGQVIMKLVSNGVQNPADNVKQAVEVAKLMQPMAAPAQTVNVEEIVERVTARLERTLTKNPEGDFIQTYERFDAFIQKVRGPAVPVAVPDGAAGWAAVAPQILGQITALVPMVLTGLQQLRAQRPGRRLAPQNGQQQNGGKTEMTLPDRIASIATTGFQKMNEGVNGRDYASYVCNFVEDGLEIFQMLQPQGPQGVMGLAAMNPQTAPFLTNPQKRAQVETFLSQFFSFEPEGSEEMIPPSDSAAASSSMPV